MNLMSLLSPSQVKWWQGCGSPGLQESLTWPRPALDSSEAGPEPRVHCGKTPPPPQGGPGPGRSPSSQSVIKGQNPEEESFSSSADRTAPPQMSPDLHSPGWGVWSDPTSQKSWLRSRCCPEERESWREEHRKLSFLPPTQVLPQACSTQSGAEGGSGHVYFWNSKPASCLIPVPMAPQCGDDDWCRFRKVGVLMPGTPCDENATLQQTASMSPLPTLCLVFLDIWPWSARLWWAPPVAQFTQKPSKHKCQPLISSHLSQPNFSINFLALPITYLHFPITTRIPTLHFHENRRLLPNSALSTYYCPNRRNRMSCG
jgi:hypothetical protein